VSSLRNCLAATLVLGALTIVADRPVAMRVEIEALRSEDGRTVVAVVIGVAPEDRPTLGDDVMVWAELARDGERIERRGWALTIDDPAAPIRVEAAWPAGAFDLRIDVKSGAGRGEGVWWGAIRVPDLTGGPPPSSPAAAPVPEIHRASPVPDVEAAVAPAAATAIASGTDAAADADAEDAAAPDAAADAAPDAADERVAHDPHPDPGTDPVAAPAAVPVPDWAFVPVLAVALDLHPPTAPDLPWIAAMVQALAERARGVVLLQGRSPAIGLRPSAPSDVARQIEALDLSASGELPALLSKALEGLEAHREMACLILVTDGLGPTDGAGWREARRAAGEAGLPILVGGIWSDGFDPGLRKELGRVADASGGGVFFLQGSEDSGELLERFGPILDRLGSDPPAGAAGER
jgi:hypothetical protein